MQEKRKKTEFSDIDLKHWKDYKDVLVESLWLLGPRDKTEPHAGDYWGNFIPQIPYQVLTRFTKRGHVVVDLFSGMGTTLIECKRLGRHGIGVEIDPSVVQRSIERITSASNPYDIYTEVLVGDSTTQETIDRVAARLATLGVSHADSVILHPPYHDIISFSEIDGDLSRAGSTEAFLEQFSRVVHHAYTLLKPSRFMTLVIGDKYANAQLIPLGFYCMQRCVDVGFMLKAINIKDIQNNERGKGPDGNLWKYRALAGGFYLFKHEYVMVFRKP